MFDGWLAHRSRDNGYFAFTRPEVAQAGKTSSFKLHVSVDEKTLPQAYEALRPLLFADSSPFGAWKLRNKVDYDDSKGYESERARQTVQRATVGMQIVLHLLPDTDEDFSDGRVKKMASSVQAIEKALSGIPVGKVPESDISLGGHVSYRSEAKDTHQNIPGPHRADQRDLLPAASDAMRQEPLYQRLDMALRR